MLTALCSLGHSAPPSDWQPVPSNRIMSTLTGHELGDGTHLTYAFHVQLMRDGVLFFEGTLSDQR